MEVSPEVELYPDRHQTPCHKCKAGDEVIYISVKYFEMMNKIRSKTLETPWRVSIMETSSDELPEVLAAKIEAIKERIKRLNDEIADKEAELTRAREERHALQMMVNRYEGNIWTNNQNKNE